MTGVQTCALPIYGKIRLFDSRTRQIYRGLVPYIVKFCEEYDYEWEYDNEVYGEEFSLSEAKRFIETLNLPIEPRDYQVSSFAHAIRSRRALLLSPTASGKSLIIYLIMRYINAKKTLIIVPTISLVSQLAGDFADYGFDSETHIHKIFSGQEKDRKSTRLNSSHIPLSRMPSSA